MNKHQKPRLTPFERETERRREEMKRNLGGRVVQVTTAFLRQYPRSVRKMFTAKPAKAVRA